MRKPSKRHWGDELQQDRLERTTKMRRRVRKNLRASDLSEHFELDEAAWPDKFPGEGFAARVVEVHKRYAFISPEPSLGDVQTRDVQLATIARKFLTTRREGRNFVCVGDRVLCTPAKEDTQAASTTDLPQCVVQHLAPRATRLSRRDPSTPGREHVLASGMDQVAVVASYRNPKVRWGLVDRYLVLAESEGIKPIIILNKRDLLEGEEDDLEFKRECVERMDLYAKLGYAAFSLHANGAKAAKDPQVTHLKIMLKNHVTAFSGHSGVGKSSVINLFRPELVQAVEPDADIFYKGRHTTSYASFIRLGTGGYVIDTPGIRSFLIDGYDAIQLTHCFIEMRPFVGKCKFRECRHVDEPGCMILTGVESGVISPWRYRSYLGILLGETGREGRTREAEPEEEFNEDPWSED